MHCVDLGESFPTSAYLKKSASKQPRTSPSKFGGKFNALFICLLNHADEVVEGHVHEAAVHVAHDHFEKGGVLVQLDGARLFFFHVFFLTSILTFG